MPRTAADLQARVVDLLERLDRGDIDGFMECFADDPQFIIESDGVRVRGRAQLRELAEAAFAEHVFIAHEFTNHVVDVERQRYAGEMIYRGELVNGRKNEMLNCNFVDFDDDGRVTRLITWHAAPHNPDA
ncbi:MAG TPA: nuclear transport factor 2 family protein [Conexibacter sp.]|jgi:hypothetical protein|nr:nuclear transport factor 2 family protein [Conexibacter sp.]